MFTRRAVFLLNVAASAASWDDEAVSLLQLQANKVTRSSWNGLALPTSAAGQSQCALYLDPHVMSTFADPQGGDQMPDFNHVPGVVPLAKSADGSIEMQMFNCPIGRESTGDQPVGFTQVQALAVRAGEDVIQIAYRPFSPATWLANDLPGKSREELIALVSERCGARSDSVRKLPRSQRDWDYYVYSNGFSSEVNAEFSDTYQLMRRVASEDSNCQSDLLGVPHYPVVYLNGVEVYSPLSDLHSQDDPAWKHDTRGLTGLDIGSGYHIDRSGDGHGARVTFQLYDAERKWQVAWRPSAQLAETTKLANDPEFNKTWSYYDPMWEMGVWIQSDMLPVDGIDGETFCGARPTGPSNAKWPMTQISFDDSLFTPSVAQQICDTCNWNPGDDKTRVMWRSNQPVEGLMPSCVVPPAAPAPPPSPPPAICEGSDVPLADAVSACSHLAHHERNYAECIMDYCISDGNPQVPAMEEEVAEEEEPLPECVGSECDPTSECTNDLQLNLVQPTHSNLGGLGPDSGRASLVYGNVVTFEGRSLDLVVKVADGSYAATKPGKNGVTDSGLLGVIGVKAGSAVNLEFKIVDSDTGEAVALPALALTFLDLDTGKKGKGVESVEVCGADSALVSEGSELGQMVSNGCTKFTATTEGSAADNPPSVTDLSPEHVRRVATYAFRNLDTFEVKLEVAKGWGQRLFLFAFHPGIACLGA